MARCAKLIVETTPQDPLSLTQAQPVAIPGKQTKDMERVKIIEGQEWRRLILFPGVDLHISPKLIPTNKEYIIDKTNAIKFLFIYLYFLTLLVVLYHHFAPVSSRHLLKSFHAHPPTV